MIFWKKKTPILKAPRLNGSIPIETEGKVKLISLDEFEKKTGAPFIAQLDFPDYETRDAVKKKIDKLHRKGELSREQVWLGTYFKKEIEAGTVPDVYLKVIDPEIGWGVFVGRDFKKMEWIAEYSGRLRKRRRADKKNAYCFEYILAPGHPTKYTIDAMDQGGVSRYINHSKKCNLESVLATVDGISHVLLVTRQAVAKGEQLTYDYGDDYWSCRPKPRDL